MKIALIGYGKMGKEIEKIAVARGHEIVSIIDINNRQDFESEAFRSADVAIEFTAPAVAYDNWAVPDGWVNMERKCADCARRKERHCSGRRISAWAWLCLQRSTSILPRL